MTILKPFFSGGLKAGGLIFFDSAGIWVIRERFHKNVYNDIGGRVESYDKNIFYTIAREFNEETYNAFVNSKNELVVTGELLEYFYNNYYGSKVSSIYNIPQGYFCLLVDKTLMDSFLTKKAYTEALEKHKTLYPNKKIETSGFEHLDYRLLLFLNSQKNVIHYRLKKIINSNCFRKKFFLSH